MLTRKALLSILSMFLANHVYALQAPVANKPNQLMMKNNANMPRLLSNGFDDKVLQEYLSKQGSIQNSIQVAGCLYTGCK